MSNPIFRQIMDGELPMPKAAATLGAVIKDVQPEAGTIVVEFSATDAFTNPIGNIQGGGSGGHARRHDGACSYSHAGRGPVRAHA